MEVRYSGDPIRFQRMNTAEVRESFLIGNLFKPSSLDLVYTDVDRGIIGSAAPTIEDLVLSAAKELAADYYQKAASLSLDGPGSTGRIRSLHWGNRGARGRIAAIDPVHPAYL